MWTNRFIVCFSQACAFVTSENVLKKSGIQLFQERLSEKVHVTVPKGIVGGFWVLCSLKKFEKMALEATDICLRVLKESNKSMFDSCSRQEPCIDHIPYFLWGLSRAHFFRQPF